MSPAPTVPPGNRLRRAGRRYRALSTANKIGLWSAVVAALAFAVPTALSARQALFPADPATLLVEHNNHACLNRWYVPEAEATLRPSVSGATPEQLATWRREGRIAHAGALEAAVLNEIGGWPEPFFYAHEETDLAWRALDADWKVLYEPELVLQHPWTSPTRHAVFHRMVARNRVWLAKRHLPALLVPFYLGVWIALTLVRARSLAGLRAWFAGFTEGARTPCPPRRPMRWVTVWRMARLGRPPVI